MLVTSIFFPFPAMFSKGFFFQGIKSQDCVIKCSLVVRCSLNSKIFFSPIKLDYVFFLSCIFGMLFEKEVYCICKKY